MGISGAKEAKFTTFVERKNLIEFKLIDGVPINITVGGPFLLKNTLNIFGNNVKNIQYTFD